jgi:GlpG protein
MRQIGKIASAADLERLTDYLLTLGITTQSEPEGTEYLVWAHEEDRIDEARTALAEFRRDPQNPRYDEATAEARRLRTEQLRRERATRQRTVDLGRRWNARPATPQVTFALIVISVAVGMATHLGDPMTQEVAGRAAAVEALKDPNPPLIQRLTITRFVEDTRTGGSVYIPLESPKSKVIPWELWRLVTPIFLHFSMMHIVFNMMSLASLGRLLEGRYGRVWMVVFVLLTGIGSNLAQYFMTGPGFGGMSGVIYALFGFAWIRGWCDPTAGFRLGANSVFIMLLWLVLCFQGSLGPIANYAHLGGLLLGAAWGARPLVWRR